jgi:hypothetical protein
MTTRCASSPSIPTTTPERGDVIRCSEFVYGLRNTWSGEVNLVEVSKLTDGDANDLTRADAEFVVERTWWLFGKQKRHPTRPDQLQVIARRLRGDGTYDELGERLRFSMVAPGLGNGVNAVTKLRTFTHDRPCSP